MQQHQQHQQHGHSSGDEHEAQGSNRDGWGAIAAVPASRAVGQGGAAADLHLQAGSSAAAGVAASGVRTVPVVPAGQRDVAFRPQRVLACLGTLLVLAHTQRQQQQQQQQPLASLPLHRRLLAAAGALDGWSLASHMPHWT